MLQNFPFFFSTLNVSYSSFPFYLLLFFSLNARWRIPLRTFRGWSCYMHVFHFLLVHFFPLWYTLKLTTWESWKVFIVIVESISRWRQWNLHAVLQTFFKQEKFGNKQKWGVSGQNWKTEIDWNQYDFLNTNSWTVLSDKYRIWSLLILKLNIFQNVFFGAVQKDGRLLKFL